METQIDSISDEREREYAKGVITKQKSRAATFSSEESELFWRGFSRGYYQGKDDEYVKKMTCLIDGYSYIYMAEMIRAEGFLGKSLVKIATKEAVRVLLERYDELQDSQNILLLMK